LRSFFNAPVNEPLFVSEKLALDECARQSGAVDFISGRLSRVERFVNRRARRVLCRAGFALIKRLRRSARPVSMTSKNFGEARARADDFLEIVSFTDFFDEIFIFASSAFSNRDFGERFLFSSFARYCERQSNRMGDRLEKRKICG
jgi:hypothetical protein